MLFILENNFRFNLMIERVILKMVHRL